MLFVGMKVNGCVRRVVLRGEIVVIDGKVSVRFFFFFLLVVEG